MTPYPYMPLCAACESEGYESHRHDTLCQLVVSTVPCAYCKGQPWVCRTCGGDKRYHLPTIDKPPAGTVRCTCVPQYAIYMPADQTIVYNNDRGEATTVCRDAKLYPTMADALAEVDAINRDHDAAYADVEVILDIVEFQSREDTW